MTKTVLKNIVQKIANKEYELLNAEYKLPKTDMPKKPIFEKFNYLCNDSNILIIYGENASGKSLITKMINNRLMDENINTRNVSMNERTSAGVKRAFLIGDEGSQSTGETSFTFLKKAFGGMEQEEAEMKSVTIFDEPDLGLSSRYSRALGRYFAEKESGLNENKAIVIISHSIEFIKSFIKHSETGISSLGVNTSLNLNDWLEDDTEQSIEELMGLTTLGRAKHSGIENKLREIRNNKAK